MPEPLVTGAHGAPVHYVDARDELEHKVARANEKLLTLIRQGEKVSAQIRDRACR